jgi:hypothetical protein
MTNLRSYHGNSNQDNIIIRVNIRNIRHVVTFSALIELEIPPDGVLTKSLSLWNNNYFSSQIKDFIFKLRSNYLKLNNRLHAFDQNVNPNCTFCRIIDGRTANRDSLLHCFYRCPVVVTLIQRIRRNYFEVPDPAFPLFYWFGVLDGHENLTEFFLSFWDIFRYNIFKFRSRRQVPNYILFENEFLFCIRTGMARTDRFSLLIRNSNPLARLAQALG